MFYPVPRRSIDSDKQNLNIRTELGNVRSKINDVTHEIQSADNEARIEVESQKAVVAVASENCKSAQSAYENAKHQYKDAQRDAEKWKQAASTTVSIQIIF